MTNKHNNVRFNIPILLIVFNRIDTTKQVLNSIKNIQPSKLYFASDGGRNKQENKIVNTVRDYVLENINWKCEIKTLFQEINKGCGSNIKASIDWFFCNEEMGIILEDDCLPNESFYFYCEELLNKYKNDKRIGMISGNNHLNYVMSDYSYLFSKFYWTWGWATWKRAWTNMDYDMSWNKTTFKKSILKNMGLGKKSYNYWITNIKKLEQKTVDAWDWQWFLSLGSQNQLSIVPKFNLVSNIGFGEGATHTNIDPKNEYIIKHEINLPLKHPLYILPDINYEIEFEKKLFKYSSLIKKIIPNKIAKYLKRHLTGK